LTYLPASLSRLTGFLPFSWLLYFYFYSIHPPTVRHVELFIHKTF
jgi:hypothetical protein